MLGRRAFEIVADYMVDRIVPAEMQPRIIVAIIRLSPPIPRQSNRVRCLVETSIADQLRGQPPLYAFKHEFIKLAIKQRAYLTLDLIRTNINVGRKRISALLGPKNRVVKQIDSAEKQRQR